MHSLEMEEIKENIAFAFSKVSLSAHCPYIFVILDFQEGERMWGHWDFDNNYNNVYSYSSIFNLSFKKVGLPFSFSTKTFPVVGWDLYAI